MDVYTSRALDINAERREAIIDNELFESIYTQYYKNVYNYISFRIDNHFDSEELASTVFENVIRKFHTYKPSYAPMEAWLIGIAKNVVTDYLRSKKRKFFAPFVSIEDVLSIASKGSQPEEIIVKNETNKELICAMSKLKDKERQVLSMKFSTDLKNCEIANILGISESNVGVIVHRAIKKLMKILGKEGV